MSERLRFMTNEQRKALEFFGSAQRSLGSKAEGVMHIPGFLSEGECSEVYMDLTGEQVAWRNARTTFTNKRGAVVTQNFEVFALKLQQGDQTVVDKVPSVRPLADKVERVVCSLAALFPSLTDWQADEAAAQRYDDQKPQGLTWHLDLARHPGIIAIVNVSGRTTLNYRRLHREVAGPPHSLNVHLGDMVLLRASGLLAGPGLLPEHGVSYSSRDRISLTFRDNLRPNDPIVGFEYDNWQAVGKIDN